MTTKPETNAGQATTTNTIRLHRVLKAPPDRVYKAILDPAANSKWLPPHGFTHVCDSTRRTVMTTKADTIAEPETATNTIRLHLHDPPPRCQSRRHVQDVLHELLHRE